MQDFNDKVAVITGGGSGVGREIAYALAREGASIVVADVDEAGIGATLASLQAMGAQAVGVRTDVTQQESVDALADAAFEAFGEVHLVFANAGVSPGEAGSMWDYSRDDWQWGFNVNVWGVLHTINSFMPRLVAQDQEAHFVITGSGNGAFVMMPYQPIYTASKAAVQAISENLYFQTLALGTPVKVNALFPGPHTVDTGIFDSDRVRPADLPGDPDKPDSGIRTVEDMRVMMEGLGIELQTTSPAEVAQTALQGLRDEKFWILPMGAQSEDAFKARVDSILERRNPAPPALV